MNKFLFMITTVYWIICHNVNLINWYGYRAREKKNVVKKKKRQYYITYGFHPRSCGLMKRIPALDTVAGVAVFK